MAVLSIAPALLPASGKPSLKDVVRRMAAYVDAYGEKASIVVGTERYQQTMTDSRGGLRERAIVADFAIVKAEANHTWIGFRDVIEVDGRRLADRENRLIDVLTSSSGSIDEARRISDESSRFNIGGLLRNFNVPTSVLFFFTRDKIGRFKFSRKGDYKEDVWEIQFREVDRPTLIRTPEGVSVPSEGTIRVNPLDGTVLRTQLRVAPPYDGSVRGIAQIDVRFERVEHMAMWLPARMDETYLDMRGRTTHTTGHAEYSNYRRFETSARIK
jgi:hypothetical protein